VKPQTWTAAGAAIATVLLTGFAFWLSYEHLHDVSASNGLTGSRAWAWPATVDLFIMIGELLMLRASLIGRGVDWWAVTLTVTGSGASIALNVAGVGKDAPTLTYVVAAVPPVAALLAFGALMRQVHDHLAEPAEPEVFQMEHLPELAEVPAEPEAEPVTLERVEEVDQPALAWPLLGPMTPVAELLAGTSHDQSFSRSQENVPGGPVPAVPPAPRRNPHPEPAEPEPEPVEVPPGVSAEHVTLARLWLQTHPKITGTEIGTRLGTSDSYGRRVRRAALGVTA
jgi:hypothetical protein